jgi:uncharacterized caspase-like protein
LAILVRLLVVLALFATGSTAFAQSAQRKVALIIANGTYASTSALANPLNDAKLVAASARKAGFQTVTLETDLTLASFQRALRDFREKASGADVAMVYYAGHGIEGSGKNWLIPVDARLGSDLDLPYEAIDLERVMEAISGAQIRMVVLDACRNNPFGRSWRSTTRAVARGLAGVEADDVLVIYAAAPGQTASDGDGVNSPFATSLAKRLVEADLPLQLLGGSVRDDVLKATGGSQRPFVSASITGTPVYLVPRSTPAAVTAAPAARPQPVVTVDNATLDALAWQGAVGANSSASYREYQRQFPKGRFATLAAQNIARLDAPPPPAPKQQAALAPPQAQQPQGQQTIIMARPSAAPAQQPLIVARPNNGQGQQIIQVPRQQPRFAPPAGTRQLAGRLIIPDSSTRRLTRNDTAQLSVAQIRIARNEIFARHGFTFSSPDMQEYFSQFSWYRPVPGEISLNEVELANIRLLQQAERARGTGR